MNNGSYAKLLESQKCACVCVCVFPASGVYLATGTGLPQRAQVVPRGPGLTTLGVITRNDGS